MKAEVEDKDLVPPQIPDPSVMAINVFFLIFASAPFLFTNLDLMLHFY